MTVTLQTHSSPQRTEQDWSPTIARQLFDGNQDILVKSGEELDSLMKQAVANKALARILPATRGTSEILSRRLEDARIEQDKRLREALRLLEETQKICVEMNIPYAVMKSLDALPDLGHDIDLLVAQNVGKVRHELMKRIQCNPVTLTFCDRQAGKFSTFIKGFTFDFELYAKISQLGEEYYSESRVLEHRIPEQIQRTRTFLCSHNDRLLITCIHTMYRHGKIRLSDLNTAYSAFNKGVDYDTITRTAEFAGIQKGFTLFIRILETTAQNFLGRSIVPRKFHEYTTSVLASDPLLSWTATRLGQRFPLKLPIALNILLFLYKSATDLVRGRRSNWVRSLIAPSILIIDKTVPLRLQKATAVRIW